MVTRRQFLPATGAVAAEPLALQGCSSGSGDVSYDRKDLSAVRAGLTESWSNGPVEGFVHKLKLIKRQMYGRAGFVLLCKRVLGAS